MPVPNTLADLTSSAATNSPLGSENIGIVDDHVRALGAILKQNASKGANLSSATTLILGNDGSHFDVIGAASIAALTNAWDGRKVSLRFLSALTLINSSNFVLPGATNLVVTANDVAEFVQESASIWRMIGYMKSGSKPDFVGLSAFTSNLNTTGTGYYYKFPNPGNGGLIVQAGTYTHIGFGAFTTFSFPTPFDNACRAIFTTEVLPNDTSTGSRTAKVRILTKSTFNLYPAPALFETNSYFVLAVGY